MPRETFERLLRRRFTLPLLIAGALLLVLANELTYTRAVDAVKSSIALADARIATARVLQLLTDAETGQRGYLLTGRSEYLDVYQKARSELPSRTAEVTSFMASNGASGPTDAQEISATIAAKLDELEKTIALQQAGDRAAALALVDSGGGKRHMDELRSIFERRLAEAATRQQNLRGFIYKALLVKRVVIAALALLLAMGLYLHLLRLRQSDRERAERQQALETQVKERTLTLRTLAGYLQTVREDEKSRLARELHDELGGVLTAGKLTLARAQRRISGDPTMAELLVKVGHQLSEGIALKRKIIEDLRPSTLSTLGLTTALAILSRDVSEQLGVPVHAEIAECHLSPDAELSIYRLVQEALTNISKYAQASEVWVRLKRDAGALQIEIADNGKGFDTGTLQVGSHGLDGMRFRIESLGGTLTVASSIGQGTRIRASVPQEANQPAAVAPEKNLATVADEAGQTVVLANAPAAFGALHAKALHKLASPTK
jgi:signal transduction histidine kinase